MPVPVWDEIQKKCPSFLKVCPKLKTAANLLIQQIKVRRNSFITIQGYFYNQFELCSLYNDYYDISTYRVHALYFLTDTFVIFWGLRVLI